VGFALLSKGSSSLPEKAIILFKTPDRDPGKSLNIPGSLQTLYNTSRDFQFPLASIHIVRWQ